MLRRMTGWALALTLALVSTATCVVASQDTPARHACRAAMDRACDHVAAADQSCCLSDAPNFSALAAAVSTVVVPPQAFDAFALQASEPTAFTLTHIETDVLDASSPPVYLVVSVFRL